MMLTKTAEYALRTLALMAEDSESTFTAAAIHERLKIPKKYLQRLLTDLTRAGFLRSVRGRTGGFVLARSPATIFLSEVVDAVGGMPQQSECFLGHSDCPLEQRCAMHEVWAEAHVRALDEMKRTSLATLFRA